MCMYAIDFGIGVQCIDSGIGVAAAGAAVRGPLADSQRTLAEARPRTRARGRRLRRG